MAAAAVGEAAGAGDAALTAEDEEKYAGVSYAVLERLGREDPSNPYVDCSRAGLLAVPQAVFRFLRLEALYLEGNQLKLLPAEVFTRLTALQYLDCRSNALTRLPDAVGQCTTLRTLLLQDNKISALPLALAGCHGLAELSLSDNPLAFPAPAVVNQGPAAVLDFLRTAQSAAAKKGAGDTGAAREQQTEARADRPGDGGSHLLSTAFVTAADSRVPSAASRP